MMNIPQEQSESPLSVAELRERRRILSARAERELREALECRKESVYYTGKAKDHLITHFALMDLARKYDNLIDPPWWSRLISTLRSKR